ncbi:MAG: transposase, partial [Oscillospiraceae bacterium]|nr:transposase [Oscillospiraceae bacterium]
MAIVQQIALESNRKIRMDFEGGELSSDGGLLLQKEFYHMLGLKPLLRKCFH